MIQKARKITCPVGEKYLPNWENKKGLKKEKDGAQENKTTTTILSWQGFLKETRVMKTRLQASKRVVSLSET
ncbi:hypothetical protein [Segatella sp.]